MHLLWEGGEEAAISPATPLVGAFHVSEIDPLSVRRASPPVRPWFPFRSFGVLRHALTMRRFPPVARAAGGWLRSASVSLIYTIRHNQAHDKNNPCIFLPKKKKQKAAEKKPRIPAGSSFYLNSTNFVVVFEHSNASTLTVIWWNVTTLPGTSAIGVSAGTFTLPFSAPLTLLCSPVSGSV